MSIPQWAEAIVNGIDVECGQNLSAFTFGQICAALVTVREDCFEEAARLFEGQAMKSANPTAQVIFGEVAAILRIQGKTTPGEATP